MRLAGTEPASYNHRNETEEIENAGEEKSLGESNNTPKYP